MQDGALLMDEQCRTSETVEAVVFRRADPEVARALQCALDRGSKPLAVCVLPAGSDSTTIRLFWDCQIHAAYPDVPLLVAHEVEWSVAEFIEDLAALRRTQNADVGFRCLLVATPLQRWGALRLAVITRRLRRTLAFGLHERSEVARPKRIENA